MKKRIYRGLQMMLPLMLALCLAPIGAAAEELEEEAVKEQRRKQGGVGLHASESRRAGTGALFAQSQALSPMESLTAHSQDYLIYGAVLRCHLYQDAAGNYVRVEPDLATPQNLSREHTASSWVSGTDTDVVYVETYDRSFKLKDVKTFPYELPIFGGFFAGEKYNFLIYGQENPDEDDQKEVYRIVKYSKDWTRLGSASILGANTVTPCDHGSMRMAEHDGVLYIRTCHTMYTASDGQHHQANMSFSGLEETMETTELDSKVGHRAAYDSHSFDQYIMIDQDGRLVALDHGDAYPRSFILSRSHEHVKEIPYSDGAHTVFLMTFAGTIGDNRTGASLGGLSESDTHYLVVANAVLEDAQYARRNVRNLKLFTVDKSNFTDAGVKTISLTSYPDNGTYSETTPQMVKINDNRFLILWETLQEKNKAGWKEWVGLSYVFVDGKGKALGEVKTVEHADLSDCQPIYNGKQVVWYATGSYEELYTDDVSRYDMVGAAVGAPVFYMIDAQTGELSVHPAGSAGGEETALPGDFDGNGKVNNKDATQFIQKLAGKAVSAANESAMDLNGDGKVNNKDLSLLIQALAGKDVGVKIS